MAAAPFKRGESDNFSMNPKLRNALAEVIQLGGIAQAAIPQFTAVSHLPPWVGPLVSLVVSVANQLYKDSTNPPTLPPSTPTS